MTRHLVECVPNFSEGRRPEVVAAITTEIARVPGVTLLDTGMDRDHNRAVVTFVAEPPAAVEAAFQGVRKAAELIDLSQHRGEHPRIGATDVVPFVPLQGTTIKDCVGLAEALGKRVADELSIPVYFYEEAARRPERRNLANIRRGQFESLRDEVGRDPDRAPDLGPARLHATAGATAIGSRFFLIAYNVNLDTADLGVAQAIAKKIREGSPGGLPAVRALGFHLKEQGVVQVSMNLTDFRKTSMAKVFERVDQLARELGVRVRESEIVGLIPEAALLDSARDSLKLRRFEKRQIIEERLKALIAGPFELHAFLEEVASSRATPGGGSAAALAGSIAAATAAKVVQLTRSKPRFEPVRGEFETLAAGLKAAEWELLRLVEADAASFRAFLDAKKLAGGTPSEAAARATALERAAVRSCEVPLATAEQALSVLRAAHTAALRGNRNLVADAVAAAALARGALEAAGAMLRVNLAALSKDTPSCADLTRRFDAARAEAENLYGAIQAVFEAELRRPEV